MELVKLKPVPERDAEKMNKLLGELLEEHKVGNVKEVTFVYIDKDNNYNFAVSGNMSTSHFSMCISYLQERLFSMIQGAGERPSKNAS